MVRTSSRLQQTIAQPATVSGFGLFQGADVCLEFHPAEVDHGIVFERTDLPGPNRIPALIDYVISRPRCTVLANEGVSVAMTEHVLAALAGLQIDNCLVRLNAAEPPACDGSSQEFVEALQLAGIVTQNAPRTCLRIDQTLVYTERDDVGIAVQPARNDEYEIGFLLDYGPGPLSRQSLTIAVSPEMFVSELADCRTFVLEQEVQALQSQGLCLRATTENALVFSSDVPMNNSLRRPDECVRHKILDCIGDFALLGCDIIGRFTATRSGHRLNHEIIRLIRSTFSSTPSEQDARPRSKSLVSQSPPKIPSPPLNTVLKAG